MACGSQERAMPTPLPDSLALVGCPGSRSGTHCQSQRGPAGYRLHLTRHHRRRASCSGDPRAPHTARDRKAELSELHCPRAFIFIVDGSCQWPMVTGSTTSSPEGLLTWLGARSPSVGEGVLLKSKRHACPSGSCTGFRFSVLESGQRVAPWPTWLSISLMLPSNLSSI